MGAIDIILMQQRLRQQQEEDEKNSQSKEERIKSKQNFGSAESLLDSYNIIFNRNYIKSNPPDVKSFLIAMIKSLYQIHPFTEVFYKKEINKEGEVEHNLYYKFKTELEHDCMLMSGLIINFENEFKHNWWKKIKQQRYSTTSDLLFKWYKDEYIKIGEESNQNIKINW